MRNAIEKLQPLYDWVKVSDFNWKGSSEGNPQKAICIEPKRNVISVSIYNNRKSSSDSKKFTDMLDAKKYMFEYINQTTLK